MSYTFDGVNKVITLNTGVVTMSVRDVYSRWVDWFISTSGNQKYLPAFLTVGGDVIDATAGTSIPIYGFLVNGWRVRPQEADHTLTINDGILLVSGGGDPFLNTLGSHVVRVNYQQPVQAITVNTGGGDSGGSGNSYTLEQIADAVWSNANRTLTQQIASPSDVIAAIFAK
jgi:hypothetical protein